MPLLAHIIDAVFGGDTFGYHLGVNRGQLPVYNAANSGVALEYEVRGTGEPVLLIHVGLCAASFALLMDEPALRGYQLIRYHRRGYAGSSPARAPVTLSEQAADAAGLVGCLGRGPFTWWGTSTVDWLPCSERWIVPIWSDRWC